MTISERLQLVEDLIAEKPNSLSIAVPTHTLEVLLKCCSDREAVKKDQVRERTRANSYRTMYRALKIKHDLLKLTKK